MSAFYQRKRRTPVIPVVPLIDILTVLLIFFVVTTTFKKHSRDAKLNINLPQSSTVQATADKTPRVPLSVNADSQIFLDGQPVEIDALAATLSGFRQTRPNDRLELKADEKAPLGTLVKIWDALTAAGLKVNTDVPTKILLKAK